MKSFDALNTELHTFVNDTDHMVEPVRQSFFRRFPVLPILLGTVGVAATFFGIERLIQEISYLNERPVLILFVGICALVITGRLYKKLQ